jgi:hypothetical protein
MNESVNLCSNLFKIRILERLGVNGEMWVTFLILAQQKVQRLGHSD